jgi:hypothetical protein
MMFSLALEMNSKLRGKLGALPFPGLRAFTPVFEKSHPPHPTASGGRPHPVGESWNPRLARDLSESLEFV